MCSAISYTDYYVAGLAMAVSLVNEGPAPRFLAPQLFRAVIGDPDTITVPVVSLPNSAMKEDLKVVS